MAAGHGGRWRRAGKRTPLPANCAASLWAFRIWRLSAQSRASLTEARTPADRTAVCAASSPSLRFSFPPRSSASLAAACPALVRTAATRVDRVQTDHGRRRLPGNLGLGLVRTDLCLTPQMLTENGSRTLMMDDLQRLAGRFRTAVLQCRNNFPGFLKNKFSSYPEECCGHASTLLGLYLERQGFTNVQYVCGHRSDGKTHAWLEIENTIVDITADQFRGLDPVVVTQDHSWHSQFEGQIRYAADLETYGGPVREAYAAAYRDLLKALAT